MSWSWLMILVAGSYGLKALGVTTIGSIIEQRYRVMVSLLPAVLFSALIVVMTFESDTGLVVDARAVGAFAGALAAWRKLPLLVVVLVAMAVSGGIRLIT